MAFSSLQESIPSTAYWEGASQSFTRLQQIILSQYQPQSRSPIALRETSSLQTGTQKPQELDPSPPNLEEAQVEEQNRHEQKIRDGILPWVVILKAGTFQLGIAAKGERLECVALGTVTFSRWIEMLWESIRSAMDEMEGEDDSIGGEVKVYEIKRGADQKIVLSLAGYEFVIRYLEAGELVRSFPSALRILGAPKSDLDDPGKFFSRSLRDVVYDLKRNEIHLDEDHRQAYYYVRAFGISNGLFSADGSGKGYNFKDYVSICQPKPGDHTTSVGDIILRFFQQMNIDIDVPDGPTSEDWENVLTATRNEPFHIKMPEFPHFIIISTIYSGSSKLKGGEWLSFIDRRVVILQERIQARISRATVRVWPQRLVNSEASPEDDIYEGYIVMGLSCSHSDISLANDINARWKVQVDEDAPNPRECFVSVSITSLLSELEDRDLKPDTRKWPVAVLKDDDTYSKHGEDEHGENKKKSGRKSPERSEPATTRTQTAESGTNENATKGLKLRPASDILSRLRYDNTYNLDDCVVGYKDRHLSKTQEKPAGDWILETTHEEFIPQHRIEYVRNGSEIIWDKQAKIDKVFKTGL